ncbi:MAG: nitroreductase family protein [Ignavibacteria bacterium]|jgi:nitroreductase|nr:nitroreductase family protein [Ignavibacteria bacterium]
MEFKQVTEKRSSVRNFTDEKIPIEKLKEMVRIAALAPCISGKETWKFIAITNKELIKKLSDVVKLKYEEILPKDDERVTENIKHTVEMFSSVFVKAPAVIAVLAEPYTAIIDKVLSETSFTHEEINKMRNHPDIQTIGAAIQNLLLAAVDMGYGACWLTGPMVAKEELSKLIGVKEPYSLIAFVAVGKSDKEVTPRIKKPVDEIFEVIE